jgi:hypothetical protein
MTYRADGSYLKFPPGIKILKTPSLMNANKEMDAAIIQDKDKSLLRDQPAVKSNQNVYDALSE